MKKQDERASGYVHWGATSQDVIDTAQMLELTAAIDLLIADIERAIAAYLDLADRHRHTATVARTWLQRAADAVRPQARRLCIRPRPEIISADNVGQEN